VDIELVKKGLHERPDELRSLLQERIDALSPEVYEAVTLAYGLCGKATAGLTAGEIPIVLPRAHDCVTLFLGSRERYQFEFENQPGTFWYVKDYVEREDSSGWTGALGSAGEMNLEALYLDYVERYGKDNADYLMDTMSGWHNHYARAAFIHLGIGDSTEVESRAREEARDRGWSFQRIEGSVDLIARLVNADWDEDFLIVKPGETIAMSFDDEVIDSFLDSSKSGFSSQ
jgi:hypothetical protein